MDLRSPETYWVLKNGLLYTYPSLQKDIVCDVTVVGGGVTGALVSHALLKAGYDTVLIDKRDIAMGSTSATTAMLQYEIDVPMIHLAEKIGSKAAIECYQAGIESIKTLQKLVKEEDIDCGFELKRSLQVAHDEESEKWLKEEFVQRRDNGMPVKWYSREDIYHDFAMHSRPGILSEIGGSVDAFRLAHELIQKNSKRGLKVYDRTTMEEVKKTSGGWDIRTDNFAHIECKHIVYCSGYETLSMFDQKYAALHSTYAAVTEEINEYVPTLDNILIWDTDDPYIYMRATDDGRFLVGGEDAKYSYGRLSEKIKGTKIKELAHKLDQYFPEKNFEPDYIWAGSFAVTKDGLPYIGRHSDFGDSIFVLGLGGNGITYSVQAMDLVVKMLKGEDDKLLHYYRFDR
ncbi:FAD-dependent oxidoreductase [Porphyromonas pogonae]|uniref:NAD(P)/FAD-dependent oxidoreductase n=1 Tax=Porphyromonas pogonae TaxID=867595 RepID=UPI002E77100D|nr:FAD-dependent oxidoreductase [Porphyromonas pogonae]